MFTVLAYASTWLAYVTVQQAAGPRSAAAPFGRAIDWVREWTMAFRLSVP